MKRKTVSFVLAIIVFIFFIIEPISAMEISAPSISENSQEYTANIAYLENVDSSGADLFDETVYKSTKTIPGTTATVEISNDNTICVSTNIEGSLVSFSGVPAGRTESGKTVFFTGTSNHPTYAVVAYSYILDTSKTNMYFKETKARTYPDSNTMVKLYIRDLSKNTLDYYMIEIFDIELNLSPEVINSLPINPLLGAWTATQFDPIDETFEEDTSAVIPYATSSFKNWSCTKSYYEFGERQTHTIKWRTNVDYSNVIKGQEAPEYFRLTVYAKSMEFEVDTDLNSNTVSYLHVNGLRVCQTSIPNTAWKSTKVDGSVQNNGWGGQLSASLGVSYGLLSLSYSIPISFTHVGSVDIDETYRGYENGLNGKYTRSIETQMQSNFKLTEIGHNFEVISTLRDYGNKTTTSQSLQTVWYVEIINASTMETCTHTCSHNVLMRVV